MEMEIGLGVPRDPVRIVSIRNGERRLVQPTTGLDVTDRALHFCGQYLMGLDEVDGFLLKSRSPSCGLRDVRIYPEGEGKAPISKDSGFFGEAVLGAFSHLAVEDEARLRNVRIAEHFLTKLYMLARFRGLDRDIKSLMQFQADNKLLLMMYGQNKMRLLGNIASNRDKRDIDHVFEQYRTLLVEALGNIPKCGASINVLMHAIGYYKDVLSLPEKKFFLETLDLYRDARVPLSVCLNLMRSYNVRFGNEYLTRQTFFEPFPSDLLEIGMTDSCALRDLS
jgi:uncharacterized protein YbgA (DUF1722 family)/uncharacterized protein YbbK (DUF523 family)